METERRVGVVATLKGAEHTLDSWILFHLAIGISKVYLFFDDSTDTAIALTKKYDPSVVRHQMNRSPITEELHQNLICLPKFRLLQFSMTSP
jgi:hypothetical protein